VNTGLISTSADECYTVA